MKSGKQRRQELKARKLARQTKFTQFLQAKRDAEQQALCRANLEWAALNGGVNVDRTALARNKS